MPLAGTLVRGDERGMMDHPTTATTGGRGKTYMLLV